MEYDGNGKPFVTVPVRIPVPKWALPEEPNATPFELMCGVVSTYFSLNPNATVVTVYLDDWK